MTTVEVIFGAVIRRLREEKGTSQEEFAAMAGVHRTYMSSIELGKVVVSISVAEKLAIALDLPLSKIWKKVEMEQAK